MLNLPQKPKWDMVRVSNYPIIEEETYLSINGASRQELASLLASETVKEEFYDNRTEIEEYYKSLND